MDVIISETNLDKHAVSKYSFKVLGAAEGEFIESEKSSIVQSEEKKSSSSDIQEVNNVENSVPVQQKDEMVQSLLKKTDELSGNYIKLQMKLEARDEEFKTQLEEIKKEAYAQGIEAGKAQMSTEQDEKIKDSINQFSQSIEKIGHTAKDLESALEPLRDELVSVAVDIAKEVIVAELSSSSADVAAALAHQLLEEVKGSTSVTLRINPKDYEHVKKLIGEVKGVTMEPDSALAAGGVVVISDVGNIEGDIMRRYERVKTAALSSE